ncbi:MAG: HAMP domain-containing histidine kinase [Clostridiales bacterium]|nr:HAMP domain-containing histidine kinase [Clostridiales bacterium]
MDTKLKKGRPILSFLSLFLGLHLAVGCVAAALLFVPQLGGLSAYWTLLSEEDYQETQSFRSTVEECLYQALRAASLEGKEGPLEPWENYTMPESPNLLYLLRFDGQEAGRSSGETFPVEDSTPVFPEAFNFILHFDGSTVTLTKDGEALDVYGDGYFTADSLWELPGYRNNGDTFFSGLDADLVSRCEVWLAVRREPIDVPGYDPIAWLPKQRQLLLAQFAAWLAAALAAAGLLLCWGLRREARERFWAGLVRCTGKIWFEWKLLVFLGSLCAFLFGCGVALRYPWGDGLIVLAVTADIFFWVLLVFRADLRRNPQARRHSGVAALARRQARRRALLPFQKRMLRYGPGVLCGILCYLFLLCLLLLALHEGGMFLAFPMTGCFFYLWFRARKKYTVTVEETGALLERIGAISRGETLPPLQLSSDSDLSASANQLNTIESGIRTAVEKQVKSERMKVELISNVSHDLKTPLTSIISYTQLLLEEDLPPAARDYAQILAQKAERLSHMVQDVFEVSKAATGNLKMQSEQIDLCKLIRQTMADMEEKLSESRLSFRVFLSPEPVFICADGQKLYRVFQNLLENVLRYSLEGTRVYLRQETTPDRTVVTIKNISREEFPAGVDLTERFVRGDESRTDGGSGLGLSIAKSFTEACGGCFSVETEGDLFTAVVSFPVVWIRPDPVSEEEDDLPDVPSQDGDVQTEPALTNDGMRRNPPSEGNDPFEAPPILLPKE